MSKIGSSIPKACSTSSAAFLMILARGSKFLYTRCPKPINLNGSFLSLALLINLSTPPPSAFISSSISITAWLAPPCRRPHRAETPDEILAKSPASDEPTKRTVEVEQFCSWSPCSISSLFSALTIVGLIEYSSEGISKNKRKIFSIYPLEFL